MVPVSDCDILRIGEKRGEGGGGGGGGGGKGLEGRFAVAIRICLL